MLNVAVTARFVLMNSVTVGLVLEEAPDHPANVEPESGVAVIVTEVLLG